MRVGERIESRIPLKPLEVDGKKALQIGDTGSLLVKLDLESHEWSLVDQVTCDIPFDDLKSYYGAWKDREITRGTLFWKKVVRERDGLIQRDEVKEFQMDYGDSKLKYDRPCHDHHPLDHDHAGWNSGRIYDVLKPDAKITVKATEQGTIAVLEEEWICVGEEKKYL